MFQTMSGHKTINIESINFKGKRYPILCDKLEIRISIDGGYKRFRNKTRLNEIRSLSSFFKFDADIPLYLSPERCQKLNLNDSGIEENLKRLFYRQFPHIPTDELLMYRTERNDYDGVSTFSIEIYLESDNKTYRIIDTPICFTYLDFFYAVQRDRYLLDFLFDPALQDVLYQKTLSNNTNDFNKRYDYEFKLPNKTIRGNNGDIDLLNLITACIFAILKKNFKSDYDELMATLEEDICVI